MIIAFKLLPIRTKCNLCPDKSSESVSALIEHYSFMHFRNDIEKGEYDQMRNW